MTAGATQTDGAPRVEDLAVRRGYGEGVGARCPVWCAPRLAVVEDLANTHQPIRLMTAARERPAAAQPKSTSDDARGTGSRGHRAGDHQLAAVHHLGGN